MERDALEAEARFAVVRRTIDEFNRYGADLDREEELPEGIFTDEPVIVPLRAMLEGTRFTGPDALEEFWRSNRESWKALHVEVESMEQVGEGVLALGLLTGTGRETGAPVAARLAWTIVVDGDLVERFETHATEADARRALGAD
jgi:hypothetical protein